MRRYGLVHAPDCRVVNSSRRGSSFPAAPFQTSAVMVHHRRRATLVPAWVFIALFGMTTSMPARAQTPPAAQQEIGILRFDANDPDIKRFKSQQSAGAQRSASVSADGHDKFANLKLPVLAFEATPQLVRNALGANAQLVKPRKVITDPAAPVWYHIVDTYGDISITVDADLRVNHAPDDDFRIHKRPLTLDGLKTGGKTRISVFDGAKDEGMEGVIAEYTVHKFPDIPYTVTIECRGVAKPFCRDVATLTKDQELLRLVAVPK